MSSRSRPTHGSSCRSWKSPTSTTSRASPRRSRSSRKRPRTIRARRWAPSPRSTITCACCTRAPACPAVPSTARTWPPSRSARWSITYWPCRKAPPCLLLAPIVQDRKGEHVEVLEQLRSQGFVRAMVDGKLIELEERPTLDARRRHSIDAVVDRLRVRPDATATSRRVVRNRARAGTGHGPRGVPRRTRARAAGVLEPLRLHDLRLQPDRARTAALFVQQPEWRMRHLRRPRRAGIFRPCASRRQSGPLARRWRRFAAGTGATRITSS